MQTTQTAIAVEQSCGTYLLYELHTCASGGIVGTCETNDNYGTGRAGALERWAVRFKSVADLQQKVVRFARLDESPWTKVVLDGVEL